MALSLVYRRDLAYRLEVVVVVVLGSPWTLVPSCGGPDDVAGSGGGGGAGGAMA